MAFIYESQSYFVKVPQFILVDREDGGHIEIHPKTKVPSRQNLTPKQAIELARLTSVVGQAFSTAMNERGVDIGRINYQDNGNWSVLSKGGPNLHIHVVGRAKSAKVNKYGQALHFPHPKEKPQHYKGFKSLNAGDVVLIKKEINRLYNLDEYKDSAWGL